MMQWAGFSHGFPLVYSRVGFMELVFSAGHAQFPISVFFELICPKLIEFQDSSCIQNLVVVQPVDYVGLAS